MDLTAKNLTFSQKLISNFTQIIKSLGFYLSIFSDARSLINKILVFIRYDLFITVFLTSFESWAIFPNLPEVF